MDLYLKNTLTGLKEKFTPGDENNVTLYVCGPTVYDRAHIGNARAVVIFDVLYRVLMDKYGKSQVTYARNITDVDDKINKAAKELNIDISILTKKTTKMFHDDMAALNCIKPNIEPKATEHIAEMISMITSLIENGHAYEAEGNVLFDVSSYQDYGNLSRRTQEEMLAGARIEVAPYKKSPGDFILWKPSNDDEPGWESPWGRGRPGWHIECSAMSTKYLGHNFDIHGGGADLKFPHHENEIAQSCCANKNTSFANYWVHNGFLTADGEKMSKSLGNFFTVKEVLEQGLKGEVIRHVLLSAHYHKPLDWNEKAILDAKKSMESFYRALQYLNDSNIEEDLYLEFESALYDDLNTPKAFAIMHEIVKQINKSNDKNEKSILAATLKKCGNLIGLLEYDANDWFGTKDADHNEIESLIEQRKQARIDKNWALSDQIRDELANNGIILEDNPDGTTSWKKG